VTVLERRSSRIRGMEVDSMTTPRSVEAGYCFWLLGLLGICGVHRFYAGKWKTGLLWLFTLGFLGIGQIIDLILIPGIIERANARLARRYGFA
jgi:TM2 domain-containing membrane protein YozV